MSDRRLELVTDTDEPPRSTGSSNGGGGNLDARLRDVEVRLARIEERLKHMALTNDITSLKVWILGGVLSGIIVAAAISATVVKAFF